MADDIKETQKELPPEPSPIDQLKEKLSAKDKIIEDQKNKLLRALADFDNYKKRMAFEQENLIQFSNEKLICELLPVLDNFERAINSVEKAKAADDIMKGISLIKKQLEDALKKFGVTEIEALHKPYDPNLHEAILQKESTEPENAIIEVMTKGYKLYERVIRPSMVIVSKGGK